MKEAKTTEAERAEILRVARCWEALQGWPEAEFPITHRDAQRVLNPKGC
jgi:hypothetical protein